jgi:hypothetical protein
MAGMRYQPQRPSRIGGKSPLARGLKIAVNAGAGYLNLVNGRILTPAAWQAGGVLPAASANTRGLGWSAAGTNVGWTSTTTAAEDFGVTDQATIMTFFVVPGDVGAADDVSHFMALQGGVGGLEDYGCSISIPPYSSVKGLRATWRQANYSVTRTPDVQNVLSKGMVGCAISTFQRNGLCELFLNGKQITSVTDANNQPVDNSTIGTGLLISGSLKQAPFTVLLACTWNRKLSANEITSLSANPWQVFEAPEEDYEVAAAASADVAATPSGVSASGSAGAAVASGSAAATPSGVAASALVGAATAQAGSSANAAPVGVSAAGSVGSATASGGAAAAPVGIAATGLTGSAPASGGAAVLANGVNATASVGAAAANGTASAVPTGVGASTAVGTLSGSGAATVSPSGVSATASVGFATASSTGAGFAAPVGVYASAVVGAPSASGNATIAVVGVAATAAVAGPGQVAATTSAPGTAMPAGVGASAQVGAATVSAGASATPAGVSAFATIGDVIAAGTIIIHGDARPLGVAAFGRVGSPAARGGNQFAQAPSGPGYTPHRIEQQSRPAQVGGSRPAATQRNAR